MTTFSKRSLLAAAMATALVGFSATALVQASSLHPTTTAPAPAVIAEATATPAAQPAAPAAEQREQKRAERMARMQQKMAERQAAFKAELKITPEQEPAWNAFVARTQPQVRLAQQQGSREDWSRLTTPERLDKMQALRAARDTALTQRADAIKGFYAALNAEQQKVFDSKRMPGFHRAGMRGGHGKKYHHHHHHQHTGML